MKYYLSKVITRGSRINGWGLYLKKYHEPSLHMTLLHHCVDSGKNLTYHGGRSVFAVKHEYYELLSIYQYCKTANYSVQDIIANLVPQASHYFILLAII